MGKTVLAEGIYWVGAIDWNLRDFHGYRTPRGSTYNAYLVVDEKTVLVDTVKREFSDELLNNITEIVDLNSIDYVVANHVEMDHSGSLPVVMEEAKNARIVATERGKNGVFKHYGRTWPFVIVKTGDVLRLGKRTLEFIEAPMLHWPDSMFTYLREDSILMPNDAFGQHLACSQRFNDEVEGAMDYASEYYANILMPFAPLILNIIQKIKEMRIAINMIAPSHGVVWRTDPERIVDAYVAWSRGVSKDKVAIVFDTMWRSTDKMARAIARGIAAEGVEVRLLHLRETDWSEIVKYILDSKAVLVGSSTLNNGMFPTVGGFLTYLKGLKPKEKIAAAFGSYGWGGGAVSSIEAELKAMEFEVLEPSLQVTYVPDEKDIERCTELGRKVAKKVKGNS